MSEQTNKNDKINAALEYAELLDRFQNVCGRTFSNKSAPRSITIDDSDFDLALHLIKYCPQSSGGDRISRMLCLRIGFLSYQQPF